MNRFLARFSVATLLALLPPMAQAGVLKEHQGHWLGELKTPHGPPLRLGAEVFTRADGSVWASVASPDQGAYDIPVVAIHEAGDSAELVLAFATMQLTWTGDQAAGEWRQGPDRLPWTLAKVADFPKKVRPQTPKGPFPYREETLSIPAAAGVTLGATLTLPKGGARPDLVILVHGSGPQTRDEEGDGHRPFAVLADHLARQGVAVLRYDKRGIARSTGDYEHHTLPQLEEDLAAVVGAMKARKQFRRIGLIGHSEGPAIAAAVAARHPKDIDFVVSMAGVGLPGLEMIQLQDRVYAQDQGASPADLERLMPYDRRWYETILAQAEPQPRLAALKALYEGLSASDKALVEKFKMNEGTLSLAWAEKPFLRVSLQADPRADWRAVRCPVLALNGSLDHQVPPENLAGLVAALREGGNRRVESAVLPSLNHAFQTAKTGAEEEYGQLEETLAPLAMQRISAFVRGLR